MKIGFFSEAQHEGKVPRNHPNARTDIAWQIALEAIHHPIPKLWQLPDNSYDIGIMIMPKQKGPLVEREEELLKHYKRVCKKVMMMQESYYNYWQDDPVDWQVWYYNFIVEMDVILCHNDCDVIYYQGLAGKRAEVMPSLMITDDIVAKSEWGNGVILGGNMVWAYGGFDSYIVARVLSEDVHAPSTGRMPELEKQMPITHTPWLLWKEWMSYLSQFNAGIQLGTPSAGTFNLNHAFHGTPCIGYSNVNTQRILHPLTTVEQGDIQSAKDVAEKLKDDKFYDLCVKTMKQRYDLYYSEEAFTKHMGKIFESLL